MAESTPQTSPFIPTMISLRTVAMLIVGLITISMALHVVNYYETRQQLQAVMHRQARSAVSTMALTEQFVSQAFEQIEDQQVNYLLAVGQWVLDVDNHHGLDRLMLSHISQKTGVFNIVVFDSKGQREFALRGQGPPPFAGRGRGGFGRMGMGERMMSEVIIQFLQSDKPYEILGRHRTMGFRHSRFSVLMKRPNAGAIVLNMSDEDQDSLRRQTSPEAFLQQMAGTMNVCYIERCLDGMGELRVQSGNLIDLQEMNAPIAKPTDTLDIEVPIPERDGATLVAGFDTAPLRNIERELQTQLLLSAGLLGICSIAGLMGTRLQRSHGAMAQALRMIRSYHRALLERIGDAVLAWNDGEGLTFWNSKAEELFPAFRSYRSGTFLPAEIERIISTVAEAGGETTLSLEDQQSGRRRFRTVYETLPDSTKTHLLVLTDVTAVEQANTEQNRRKHVEDLAKIASGVAHEVRNPLNAIDMTIQTLCMEPSRLDAEDRSILQELRGEIARINKIVEHFLAYGRPQPPMFAETDLPCVVRDTAEFINPLAEREHIQIEVQSEDVPAIHADAQQLRQAILNVVLNAIEASPPHSTIVLWVKQVDNYIKFSCRDTGSGMTPEQREHLFDPYYTTKSRGTGLGMSIVQRIVEAHNGVIDVFTQAGQGTEITLSFSSERNNLSQE